MDHDAHLRLLGLLTARSHQLELVTAQIMARAITVPESTGRLLVSATGVGAALSVLQALATRGETGLLSRGALSDWLRQAKVANQARNRVIHSPWVVRDEAEVPLPTRSRDLEFKGSAGRSSRADFNSRVR